ncbi:MAG TPA: thermonuclease family protein [Dehalococcoidia bacterium]|nr:thermonuclease family protein [Dehalococcoidia bacterium]
MYEYKAKVIDVYDADTMRVDIDLGFGVWIKNQVIRWLKIDAWEMRGEERPKGILARDRVRDLILEKEVLLKTYKDEKGKYGRWLAEVYYIDTPVLEWSNSINQQLINENHAVPYE